MAIGPLDFFGYIPSLSAAIAFLVLFTVLTTAHTIATLKARRDLLWLLAIPVGGVAEIMGWSARIASHVDSTNINSFLMQQCTLILGPTFFSAALYGILGAVVVYVAGPQSSGFLRPKILTTTFIICDLISIAVQGAGGGQVAQAVSGVSGPPSKTGTWIMVAGIIFQLVVMVVFLAIAAVFYLRTRSNPAWQDIRLLSAGVFFASVMILIRGVFRSIELSEGWNGYLYTTEPFMIGLDAVPMVLCMLCLALTHPLFTLPPASHAQRIRSESTLGEKSAADARV